MIGVDAFIARLLRLLPELAATLNAEKKEWAPKPVPLEMQLELLAAQVVEMLPSLPKPTLQAILNETESVLAGGNAQTADAVSTGFLEELDNLLEAEPKKAAALHALLGPKSHQFLKDWHKFMNVENGLHTKG